MLEHVIMLVLSTAVGVLGLTNKSEFLTALGGLMSFITICSLFAVHL